MNIKRRSSVIGAVAEFFEKNSNRIIQTKDVYAEVYRVYPLTPLQLEVVYARPRFHHTVRSALLKLTKSQFIIKVSKDHYKYNKQKNKLSR